MIERLINLVAPFLLFPLRFVCVISGHDWFNGGEVCRDCAKPRPQGWVYRPGVDRDRPSF